MAGAEEAFRVALQTATTAAQAATAALAEIKRSQAAGLASKPKELELTGRPEEDRRLWSDWKFAAVQYLMTKDVAYQEEIDRHIRSENQVRMDQLSEAEKGRSRQLFSFLAGTAKGDSSPWCGRMPLHQTAMGSKQSEGFSETSNPQAVLLH